MQYEVSFRVSEDSDFFKTFKLSKKIIGLNSVSERRHLKIPQIQIETFQIQPFEFRNAGFGWKLCSVWAYGKHS